MYIIQKRLTGTDNVLWFDTQFGNPGFNYRDDADERLKIVSKVWKNETYRVVEIDNPQPVFEETDRKIYLIVNEDDDSEVIKIFSNFEQANVYIDSNENSLSHLTVEAWKITKQVR